MKQPVVADEEQRAVVVGERLGQHVARFHVEMVRGLVQHQEVRAREQELGEREPRLLAAREHGDLLVDLVAREQERAEDAAQARHVVGERVVLELAQDRAARVERVDLVLGVEGAVRVVAELARAAVRARARRRRAAAASTCRRRSGRPAPPARRASSSKSSERYTTFSPYAFATRSMRSTDLAGPHAARRSARASVRPLASPGSSASSSRSLSIAFSLLCAWLALVP